MCYIFMSSSPKRKFQNRKHLVIYYRNWIMEIQNADGFKNSISNTSLCNLHSSLKHVCFVVHLPFNYLKEMSFGYYS